jgi:hypothetical protein
MASPSPKTISHAPFFKALSDIQPGENGWHSTFAGLSLLRLIDSYAGDATRADKTEALTIESAKRAATAIPQTDPTRAILLRALDGLESNKGLSEELGRDLLRYGRALDLEGRWSLASDVFKTMAESFPESRFPELVVEASTALGAAARNSGDWQTSDRGYARAQYLADTIHNLPLSLTARLGAAASSRVRGNLPAAEIEIEEVLAEARSEKLQQVEAVALHESASLAHSRRDYQRAIHHGYASLELTTNLTARDRILGDIAAAYAGLGLKQPARDGYSIVALTSPHQWVRWQATLNLMELAVEDGDEESFDDLVAQMANAKLDPRLNAYRLYYQGMGLRRFGRDDSATMMREAMDFASKYQLHQLAHEIEESIERGVVVSNEGPAKADEGEETRELQHIAEALARLREDAVSQSG